jgi:hypothetical protein
MADEVKSQSALNTLLSITEKSGNLRKDLKQDIVDSVSRLRNIFVNLQNTAEEQIMKITQLESEVTKRRRSFRRAGSVTYRGLHSHLGAEQGKLPHSAGYISCHLPVALRNFTPMP